MPRVVIASSDNDSLFEMYLLRCARKRRMRRVTVSATINVGERKDVAIWSRLQRHYMVTARMPALMVAVFTYLKGGLGHFFIYWILPLLNLQLPFWGRASYVLFTGHSGMRDSECHVVFSEREYGIYLRSGVPASKLANIPHPVSRSSRVAFEKLHLSRPFIYSQPIAVVLHPAEFNGFTRTLEIIDSNVYTQARKSVLDMIPFYLKGWTLILKPHPILSSVQRLKNCYGDVLSKYHVVDSSEPVEPYLMQAKLVVDMPRAASTSTLFATLANPSAWIAVLDFHQEFLGDCFCNMEGINYITSLQSLADFLQQVVSQKKSSSSKITTRNVGDFIDLPELLHDKGML